MILTWQNGVSSLVLVFKTKKGERRARSFDNNDNDPQGSDAPVLAITFSPKLSVRLPVCLEQAVTVDDDRIVW